jgi:catechol 2,3-dioxygenase-like lactoylglutathione lyase family enzyme
MTSPTSSPANAHRWYTRPVLFVADAQRAARFYVEQLGFTKDWHADDGAGPVCQVNHGECEVILCEDEARAGHGRLYIELTSEALAVLRGELAARGVAHSEISWGNDVTRIVDVDGNELFFPHSD